MNLWTRRYGERMVFDRAEQRVIDLPERVVDADKVEDILSLVQEARLKCHGSLMLLGAEVECQPSGAEIIARHQLEGKWAFLGRLQDEIASVVGPSMFDAAIDEMTRDSSTQ